MLNASDCNCQCGVPNGCGLIFAIEKLFLIFQQNKTDKKLPNKFKRKGIIDTNIERENTFNEYRMKKLELDHEYRMKQLEHEK